MKYQDPSNPMSSSDMMAQTATLTQTQSLQTIADQNKQLLALQRSLTAGALVGRTVSYTGTDGTTQSGTRQRRPDRRHRQHLHRGRSAARASTSAASPRSAVAT